MGETCNCIEDKDAGIWVTDCGHFFGIHGGIPSDYQMHWCTFCGKIIQAILKDPKD
jgi:hypothetical protein